MARVLWEDFVDFSVFFNEKVRSVETCGQVSTPVQLWTRRAEAKHSFKDECCSQLKGRVQRVMIVTDENEGFDEKGRVLNLLKFRQMSRHSRKKNNRKGSERS